MQEIIRKNGPRRPRAKGDMGNSGWNLRRLAGTRTMNAISAAALGLFAVLFGVPPGQAQGPMTDSPARAAPRPSIQPKVSWYEMKHFKVTSVAGEYPKIRFRFAGGQADGVEAGHAGELYRGSVRLARVEVEGVGGGGVNSSGRLVANETDPPISVRVGDEVVIRMYSQAGAMLHQADRLMMGNTAKAQELYEEVIARYGGSGMAAEAMLRMAQICREKKDTAAEIEWLRKCAATERIENGDLRGEDGSCARPSAIERLAQIHFLRKDWKKALGYAKAMEVFGWCGNGQEAIVANKRYYIAVCQLRLGQVDEAMKVIEPRVFDAKLLDLNGLDAYRYMVLLCDFADENGKLDDLEGRLRKNPWKGASPSHGSQMGLEYIELLRMLRGKDPQLLERLKTLIQKEGGCQAYGAYFALLARIGSKEAMDFINSMATGNVYGERRYAAQAALEELNAAAPHRTTD